MEKHFLYDRAVQLFSGSVQSLNDLPVLIWALQFLPQSKQNMQARLFSDTELAVDEKQTKSLKCNTCMNAW